jgi:hypothetical protein
MSAGMTVWAQPGAQAAGWTHGTTLNVFAGAATDSSSTGPVGGAAIGWEFTPRIAIEGSGYWFDRAANADAFAAAVKVQGGLIASRVAMPFVEAGVGLYRASFEPTATAVPDFYRRRISTGPQGPGTTHTFTDPAFVFGGGVNVFLSRHLAIRPHVEAMAVRRDRHDYLVTSAAVRVAYYFESRPVTPLRGSNDRRRPR